MNPEPQDKASASYDSQVYKVRVNNTSVFMRFTHNAE